MSDIIYIMKRFFFKAIKLKSKYIYIIMSLNDYARLSNNDLELYKQLSDSSYRSINGKRQSSRNFKEGVLNLGQIHFEQPKNVLTKEMILEYQKEQQNKPAYEDTTTGDKFKYLPTDINEKPITFNPTNLPSGVAATENDVGTKKFEIQNALKTLKDLDNEEIENRDEKEYGSTLKVQVNEGITKMTSILNEATKQKTNRQIDNNIIDNNIKKLIVRYKQKKQN